jgi:hypothetical protein
MRPSAHCPIQACWSAVKGVIPGYGIKVPHRVWLAGVVTLSMRRPAAGIDIGVRYASKGTSRAAPHMEPSFPVGITPTRRLPTVAFGVKSSPPDAAIAVVVS